MEKRHIIKIKGGCMQCIANELNDTLEFQNSQILKNEKKRYENGENLLIVGHKSDQKEVITDRKNGQK